MSGPIAMSSTWIGVGARHRRRFFRLTVSPKKWGQNWGVPIYRWDELEKSDFAWWRTRIDNIRKIFHLYRIDHGIGFFRVYSFPWPPDRNDEFLPLTPEEAGERTGGRLPGFQPFPDDTPTHCAANRRQGEVLLGRLQEASGDTAIVVEDLGMVPPYMPASLEKLGLAGFRIPALFRDRHGDYLDPAEYPCLSARAVNNTRPRAARGGMGGALGACPRQAQGGRTLAGVAALHALCGHGRRTADGIYARTSPRLFPRLHEKPIPGSRSR